MNTQEQHGQAMKGCACQASHEQQATAPATNRPTFRDTFPEKLRLIERGIRRGEALGTGLCALGVLMKAVNQDAVDAIDGGECLINSLGYLVECIGGEILGNSDDLRDPIYLP